MLYKGDCQSDSFAMHAGTGLHLQQHLHNKSWQLSIVQPVSISGETCKGGSRINYFTASTIPILTRGQIFWAFCCWCCCYVVLFYFIFFTCLQVLYRSHRPSFGVVWDNVLLGEHISILFLPLRVCTTIPSFIIFQNLDSVTSKVVYDPLVNALSPSGTFERNERNYPRL